jgi:hypothetical protein
MSDKRKLQTEIEWREPIDLDAVAHLIGATNDFRAGARSYLDDLEGQAIWLLEFDELPRGDREVLELSSNVIRSLFDELANTFVEPYRETQPALAEQGYQMLWAVMKAASNMAAGTQGSIARKIAADVQHNATSEALSVRKQHDEYADARLTEAVAKAMNKDKTKAAVSDSYVKKIEGAVRDDLKQSYRPIKKPDGSLIKKPDGWPRLSTIKEKVRQSLEQREG